MPSAGHVLYAHPVTVDPAAVVTLRYWPLLSEQLRIIRSLSFFSWKQLQLLLL